jgi:dTDP-4-amino-4,6-dideoxygalactose transaminase
MRNAAIIRETLADVPGLILQEIPKQAEVNAFYLLLGRIDAGKFGKTRDQFHKELLARDVPCAGFYPHTLYQNPLYQQGNCRVEPCPVSEACIQDAFWFPHRMLMGDEETTRSVAAAIAAVHATTN